jgi:3-oxoacyl-(acyl-carrier-protein) synthase
MADRVVVTATGIITAIGSSEKEHLDAFRDGRIGLHRPLHLQSKHSQDLSIGAVNLSNDELIFALIFKHTFTITKPTICMIKKMFCRVTYFYCAQMIKNFR